MAEGEDNKAFFSDREISSFQQYEDPNAFNLANQQSLPTGYEGFREPVSHQIQFHQQPSSHGITGFEGVEEKMEQEILDPIENPGSSVSPIESGLAYMRSEDVNKNFAMFASLIDEPAEQKILKLNEFYSQNKVIQGLNCFFMLDNGSHHHPINFSEDPNFSLDQNFFEEKTKNTEIPSMSHLQQEQKQQQQTQQSKQEQTQQENIYGYNFQDNKTEDDKVFLNEFIEGYLQNEDHNQNELSQQQGEQSHQPKQEQINSENRQERTQNHFIQQTIFSSESFHQYQPAYNHLQANCQQQMPQQHQQPLPQPQNGSQHQQPPPPHQATYSHMFNLHEAAAKVSSKNAMQKSSTSFLDKVNFAVDDFLDKADPTEYPALSRGEDFLLRNLRNYLALEFTQKEQTSYFQKILNSSYQIFLHRLKLLIDQKRMDTKTLLPFICRFSIDIAEKLLQFIYKCDDAFTMKIIREHPFPSQDDPSFQPAEASMNFEGLENLRSNFMTSNSKKDNRTPSHAHSLSEASQSSASHASVFPYFNDFEPGKNESQSCFQESTSGINNNTLDPRQKDPKIEQGNSTQHESQQQQYHFPGENIEAEEEEDCLPFAPQIQQSQQYLGQNDSRRGQRKPWTRQELQILNNLYNEYQQKIPPWKMEELTKKFNRSIQSIQSKVQKMRRSSNSHPVTLASSFTLPVADNYLFEGSNKTQLSSTMFSQSQKVSDITKSNGYQSQSNPFGNLSSNSQLGGSLNNHNMTMGMSSNSTMLGGNLGLIKMENKLRVCLYELPSHEGTKSQILAKMRDKYYAGSNQSQAASWEKSASQMLSSASFQKRRGVFTLREEVVTPKREQLDVSGTNKQKLTYVLSLLPQRTGTLLDILNTFQITFPSNLNEIADQRKLKDNISKTLNAYDTFDKSFSKTIYYLTQQEILAIDAEQKQQQNLGSNNNHNTINHHQQHMYTF